MGFETPEEGYLAKIIVQAGTKDVAIGKVWKTIICNVSLSGNYEELYYTRIIRLLQLVCIIVENADDVAAFKDYKDEGGSAAATPKKAPESKPAPSQAPPPSVVPSAVAASAPAPPSGAGRPFASPLARSLAAQRGLDLSVSVIEK